MTVNEPRWHVWGIQTAEAVSRLLTALLTAVENGNTGRPNESDRKRLKKARFCRHSGFDLTYVKSLRIFADG